MAERRRSLRELNLAAFGAEAAEDEKKLVGEVADGAEPSRPQLASVAAGSRTRRRAASVGEVARIGIYLTPQALGPPNRSWCRQAPLLQCGPRSQRISRQVDGCLTAHGVVRQSPERSRLHVPPTAAYCRPRRSGFLIDSHGESIRESGVNLAP